jgi:hypothetical protein
MMGWLLDRFIRFLSTSRTVQRNEDGAPTFGSRHAGLNK